MPPTPIDPSAPTLRSADPPSAPSSSLSPGQTLANRYRIVTLLGRGGMGAVYRADDLELGAPVALKLLPPDIAADPISLDRFRAEVRLARNISHANIVRVYDLAQADGQTFLSMEFVDGEDLGSLLRRIGRLPHDKAVQIARQLCFGLAAAHEQGVIHRDLKPANIMIDGRGNARIMDFGVAGIAANLIAAGDITSGTPAYMAPEQLAGKEVSKKSDLYSLGLVLYELFTGKPALVVPASTTGPQSRAGEPPIPSIADLRAFHAASSRPESLSRHVADIDPAVERIILRCLEPDPAERPASAVAIAAALPGGDPLAAALAAGETPSPELIAASGASLHFSPLQAWGRAALIAAMIFGVILLTARWTMVSQIKPAKSPEVLQDHALEALKALGYTDPPADSARGFNSRDAFISRINRDASIKDKTERLRNRPGVYEFWYRQSPAPIDSAQPNGMVFQLSPFPALAHEIVLRSDSSGRLEYFAAVPPRRRADTAATATAAEIPDITIKRLFDLAELDQSRFTPAEPIFRPFVPTDTMRSWTGTLADQSDQPIRIHLGAVEGKVVYFSVAWPWSVSAVEAKPAPPEPTSPLEYAAGAVLCLVILGTCRMVYTNLRSGRGDRTSAFRIAIAVFFFALLNLLFICHRLPTIRSIFGEGGGFAAAAFAGAEFWFFYIALEPYARRVYPQSLISWTRVLRGQLNDPLVGRHILIGLLLGSFSILCTAVFVTIYHTWFRESHPVAFYGRTGGYLGGFPVIASLSADTFVTALMLGTGSMLPVVTGQLFLKRRWAGYLMLILALAALDIRGLNENRIDGTINILIAMIPVLAVSRGGLLALVTTHMAMNLGQMLPIGLDWTHWFTAPAYIPAAILAALTILSARAASVGRAAAL